jgi:hypothetical protein
MVGLGPEYGAMGCGPILPEVRCQLASGAPIFGWNSVDLNMHISVSKSQSTGVAGGASLLDGDNRASSFSIRPRRNEFEICFEELLEANANVACRQNTGSPWSIMINQDKYLINAVNGKLLLFLK